MSDAKAQNNFFRLFIIVYLRYTKLRYSGLWEEIHISPVLHNKKNYIDVKGKALIDFKFLICCCHFMLGCHFVGEM